MLSAVIGAPVARLRPTGTGDEVEVLWWCGERWVPFGGFSCLVLPLDQVLDFVASEPAFWINAQ